MNIGFFINDIRSERAEYASTCLAAAAVRRGHRAWYIGVEDMAYDPNESVSARARVLSKKKYKNNKHLLDQLQREDCPVERIDIASLDVLLLRNNPAEDVVERPWAQSAGVIFGQFAARQGVLVLNDPGSLANALNKLYFQFFPEEIRPRSLITRDRAEIRGFVEAHPEGAVLKPLQGSGGQNVFLVKDDLSNLNQIIDAILRDSYVVAQEYLPAASEGDLRLMLMNGRPLTSAGKIAAFRRVNVGGDLRSNIHAGGEAQPAEIDDAILAMAEIVGPKLIQDGMFLVGLDIAGDKLMEVNVFSPGGLYSMERFEGVSFSDVVIESLETKVAIRRRYPRDFSNVQLATM
jgi:glutathione synthase